jgi:hypothetical protein
MAGRSSEEPPQKSPTNGQRRYEELASLAEIETTYGAGVNSARIRVAGIH